MVVEIEKILEEAKKIENWKINLVKINISKREGIKYFVDELSDFDNDGILRTVKEIIDKYTIGDKANLYNNIQHYDSVNVSNTIYEMENSDKLIKEAYNLFINALANSNKENDPTKDKYDCYVLESCLENNDRDIPIKFIFMNNPIKILKNKFIKIDTKYKEITDKVIALSLCIDMIIYGNKFYFFNNSCEKFFNMDRTYKIVCQEKIKEIENIEIISDIESFKNIACSGHNPKRFISFNEEKLESLKDVKIREKISEIFNIPLKDGKYDTLIEGTSEKLIKVLCDKGKIDPFNNKPVEVAGAKEWR